MNNIATLTLSEDKKTLFVTSMSGSSQEAYRTGNLLIDFLELDYYEFIIKYPVLNSIIGTSRILELNEFDVPAEEVEYNDVRKQFLNVAHICFDSILDDQYKDIEKGNMQHRYSYYTLVINPNFEKNNNLNLRLATVPLPYVNNKPISLNDWKSKILNNSKKGSAEFIISTQPIFEDSYYFNSWFDIMYFELINILKGNIVVKRCENCNRFFVPVGRNDTLYCNRIVPGTTKTCSAIGAIVKYEKEVNSNPIKKAYRKEYKKRYARVLKGKMDYVEFVSWADSMKNIRDKALQGILSYEDFIEKIK